MLSTMANEPPKKNEETKKLEEAKKLEEQQLKPHPVKEQLPGVQYCINSPPPWSEVIFLGFQHYLVTLGTIVLIPSIIVPQMGGNQEEKAKVIQSLLFVSGINTLMQSFFGTRLPSVISGSYAYLIPLTSIVNSKRHSFIEDPHERFIKTMRAIQGALIVTSCFQIIVGFLGVWRNFVRFLTPLSVVPLISFGGLGLYYLGFPLIATCAQLGIPELILVVFISQYLPSLLKLKRPLADRYAVLFSVPIVWMLAGILTWSGAYKNPQFSSCRIDHGGLYQHAPWVYIPLPFQWGSPTFGIGDAFSMLFASFIASTESTGAFLASARYGSATPVPPSVISRGIGWLGIGTLLSGIVGGITGSAATVENAGLLALTKAGSRRIVQMSSAFMIFFSVLGKFGAVFASIPLPIMAGFYCVCFAYVSSAGFGFLQFCNLNSFRTKFVLGFSFFIGLSLPQYFREHQLSLQYGPVHTSAAWFNDIVSVIFTSHAMVAVLVALFLDCTLQRDPIEEPQKDKEQPQRDNGSHWWEKFVLYNKDVRSDEFYKLPYSLNKFFPPV